MKDITQSGNLSYKDLQRENELDEKERFNQAMIELFSPYQRTTERDYTLSRLSLTRKVPDPMYQSSGGKDYWGNSIFDETDRPLSQYEYEHLQDTRANNQPAISKIINGTIKGGLLIGTTFVDGSLGFLYGIGKGVSNIYNDESNLSGFEKFTRGLYDNEISQGLRKIEELGEKYLPNYYTQYEQEHPLALDNIFSANFLGDKLIKNLGFMVGAYYSGGIYAGLAKGLTRGIRAGIKTAKGLNTLKEAYNFNKNTIKLSNEVAKWTGAITSSLNEGRIEAVNTSNQWFEYNKTLLDKDLEDKLAEVDYLKETNPQAYQQYADMLQDNYNKKLDNIKVNAARVGNMDLLLNQPILLASNLFQFSSLFARGFDSYSKGLKLAIGKEGPIFKAISKPLELRNRIAKNIGNALSEGKEEWLQQFASDWSGENYKPSDEDFYNLSLNYAEQDPITHYKTADSIKAMMTAFNSNWNNESTWEQFLIGTFSGALGMPTFGRVNNRNAWIGKNKLIGLTGGLFEGEDIDFDKLNENVDALNKRIQDPEFKKLYKGLIRHNKFESIMQAAALAGDRKTFEDGKIAQMVSDIILFSETGQLNAYIDLLNEANPTDDNSINELKESIMSSTPIENRATSPFFDSNGNIKSNESIRQSIEKNKSLLNDIIKSVSEEEEHLTTLFGNRITREQKNELVWMKTRLDTNQSRIEDIINNNPTLFNPLKDYITNIKEGQPFYESKDTLLNLLNSFITKSYTTSNLDFTILRGLVEKVFNRNSNDNETHKLKNLFNDILNLKLDSVDIQEKYNKYVDDINSLAEEQAKETNKAKSKSFKDSVNKVKEKVVKAGTKEEAEEAVNKGMNTIGVEATEEAIRDADNSLAKNNKDLNDAKSSLKQIVDSYTDIDENIKRELYTIIDDLVSLNQISVDSITPVLNSYYMNEGSSNNSELNDAFTKIINDYVSKKSTKIVGVDPNNSSFTPSQQSTPTNPAPKETSTPKEETPAKTSEQNTNETDTKYTNERQKNIDSLKGGNKGINVDHNDSSEVNLKNLDKFNETASTGNEELNTFINWGREQLTEGYKYINSGKLQEYIENGGEIYYGIIEPLVTVPDIYKNTPIIFKFIKREDGAYIPIGANAIAKNAVDKIGDKLKQLNKDITLLYNKSKDSFIKKGPFLIYPNYKVDAKKDGFKIIYRGRIQYDNILKSLKKALSDSKNYIKNYFDKNFNGRHIGFLISKDDGNYSIISADETMIVPEALIKNRQSGDVYLLIPSANLKEYIPSSIIPITITPELLNRENKGYIIKEISDTLNKIVKAIKNPNEVSSEAQFKEINSLVTQLYKYIILRRPELSEKHYSTLTYHKDTDTLALEFYKEGENGNSTYKEYTKSIKDASLLNDTDLYNAIINNLLCDESEQRSAKIRLNEELLRDSQDYVEDLINSELVQTYVKNLNVRVADYGIVLNYNPAIDDTNTITPDSINNTTENDNQSGIQNEDLTQGEEEEYSRRKPTDEVITTLTKSQIKELVINRLSKILPQLSRIELIEIVDNLYNNDVNATINLANSLMKINSQYINGIEYHEAFHYVFNNLLTLRERNRLLLYAKNKYNLSNNKSIEEKLADGFMEYMLNIENKTYPNTIKGIFQKLIDRIKAFVNNNIINSVYRDIASGKYKNNNIGDTSIVTNKSLLINKLSELNYNKKILNLLTENELTNLYYCNH